jgi:large subunit ribosomal protein L9
MKVILLKDVAKVGRKFEVKELADGFARNFIIARGLGQVATESNLKRLEILKSEKQKNGAGARDLNGVKIILSAKANEEGHLFASIHKEEILKELQRQEGISLEIKQLELPEPIKAVGEHEVKVNYDAKTSTFFTILVRPS